MQVKYHRIGQVAILSTDRDGYFGNCAGRSGTTLVIAGERSKIIRASTPTRRAMPGIFTVKTHDLVVRAGELGEHVALHAVDRVALQADQFVAQ